MDADESYMDVFMRSHKPDLRRRLVDESDQDYLEVLLDKNPHFFHELM